MERSTVRENLRWGPVCVCRWAPWESRFLWNRWAPGVSEIEDIDILRKIVRPCVLARALGLVVGLGSGTGIAWRSVR